MEKQIKIHIARLTVLVSIFTLQSIFAPRANADLSPYDVECEDAEQCPGYIAGIRNMSGVCTSFLVAPKVMATNLHCVPEDLRVEGARCNGKIKVTFPKSKAFPIEYADCEEIISISPPVAEGKIGVDYAFFRIKNEVQRPVLDIVQKGVPDSTMMTIFKVDPTGTKGIVKKVQCEAIQKTVINPYFLTDVSPLVLLSPCSIMKGNSGSPILFSDGSVRGIVSSITSVPQILSIPTSSEKTVAFGSNFSCINTFFLGRNQGNPKDCDLKIDEGSQKKIVQIMNQTALESLNTELNKAIKDEVLSLEDLTKSTVRWTVHEKDPSPKEAKFGVKTVFEVEPFCLLPKVRDVASYSDKLKDEPVSYPLNIKRYLIRFDLDKQYRIKGELETQGTKGQLSMVPKDFLKRVGIPVLFNRDEGPRINFQIPLCSSAALQEK